MLSEKQVKLEEKIDQAIEFCQNESQYCLLTNCSECDNLHNEGFQEFSILSYICREEQVIQYHSKIKRHFSKNKKMLYYYDGQLIKIEKISEGQEQSELEYNLEQIRYLNWVGEYGNNKRKTGKWIATWKGENLDVGGFYGYQNLFFEQKFNTQNFQKTQFIHLYCEQGNKQGQWKEIIKGYWDQSQIYQTGKYQNSIKQGVWKFVQENKEIGGGEYNIDGIKIGQWLELSEYFNRYEITQQIKQTQ